MNCAAESCSRPRSRKTNSAILWNRRGLYWQPALLWQPTDVCSHTAEITECMCTSIKISSIASQCPVFPWFTQTASQIIWVFSVWWGWGIKKEKNLRYPASHPTSNWIAWSFGHMDWCIGSCTTFTLLSFRLGEKHIPEWKVLDSIPNYSTIIRYIPSTPVGFGSRQKTKKAFP